MALDKIKNFFGVEENTPVVTGGDDEFYKAPKGSVMEDGTTGNKMMLLEPRAYSESQQIADYLKNRNAVVVNLKRVTPDQAKRIVDFLSGTLYAIGGDLQKLGGGIFLCTPNNVNVEGKITDENAIKSKGKGREKEDEEEFNW
ncbi:MAG: cell division protein SepF [Bacilli bacterium]